MYYTAPIVIVVLALVGAAALDGGAPEGVNLLADFAAAEAMHCARVEAEDDWATAVSPPRYCADRSAQAGR